MARFLCQTLSDLSPKKPQYVDNLVDQVHNSYEEYTFAESPKNGQRLVKFSSRFPAKWVHCRFIASASIFSY